MASKLVCIYFVIQLSNIYILNLFAGVSLFQDNMITFSSIFNINKMKKKRN